MGYSYTMVFIAL